MKKLMMAAIVAGSMFAMADEAAAPVADAAAPAAEAVKAKRAKMTPEQRAELRAKREKMVAERKAAMEAKKLEIVKKYGLDDEKAKALLNELQEAKKPVRRPRSKAKRPAEPAKAE